MRADRSPLAPSKARQDRQRPRQEPTFARAALLAAALGALLFVHEQAHTLAHDGERLSLILLPVYTVLFAALGLAGAALLRFGGSRLLLALAAAAYYLTVALANLLRWRAGEPIRGAGSLLLSAALLALALAPIRHRAAPWLRAAAAAALALGWALAAPERAAFGNTPLAWWGHAFFLAAALAFLLEARRNLPLPRANEPAALTVLLLAGLGVHVAAGATLFDNPRTAAAPEPQLAASARSGSAAAAARDRRPNVVLVVWDGVRRDHLSAYGYHRPTTPFLEELSRRAVVYTRATAAAPWTLPSHVSMLTGLYPRTHGAHSRYRRGMDPRGFYYHDLPAAGPATLAERLREAGYRTGAVSANFYFAGRRVGLGRGFDLFRDDRNPFYLDPVAGFRLAGRLMAALETRLPMGLAARTLTPYIPAREVSDRALAFIDQGEPGRPFFLFLNYMDAHEPYNPAPRHRHRFPGFRRPLAFAQVRDVWFRSLEQRRPIAATERAHLDSQYDAALLTLDEEARRLAAELERRGLFDDTLLVFTSDHGELLGEHGMTGHGQDLYEELTGIPMIVKLPGERRRGRDGSGFENRDLFHLALAEAGLAVGPAPARPWEAAAERYPAAPNPLADGTPVARLTRGRRTVSFAPYKFIASTDGEEELYDLARDPAERANLARALPQVADRGRDLVRSFLRTVPAAAPRKEPGGGIEDVERLRALGYAAR